MTEKKVALVTGGSAGLGEAIARSLAQGGFDVAICARRADRLAAMQAEGFSVTPCDIGSSDDVARLKEWIIARYDRLDVLVNCAAVALQRSEFIDIDFAEAEKLIRINVLGTLSVTHSLLPLLVRRGGSIVNFSSTLAQRPRAGSAVYSVSKGAIETFTKALALELAKHNIRVNCVAPALVRSDIYIAAGMSPEDYAKLLEARAAEFPLRRVGEPDDVSELVSFLVSEKAGWMTGIVVPVDGGALLR